MTDQLPPSSEERSELTARLVDEYLSFEPEDERPSLEKFLRPWPEVSDEVRAEIETAILIEQLAADEVQEGLGETIDDYRVVREIGRGGMGIVYEAVQISLGRPVALKLLPPGAKDSEGGRERFLFEAQIAARLNHPNIVEVFEVGEVDGLHFYAMQLVEGASLDRYIRAERDTRSNSASRHDTTREHDSGQSLATTRLASPVERLRPNRKTESPPSSAPNLFDSSTTRARSRDFRKIAEIGVRVADALACAHDAGVVHRDIKPSNLLVDRDAHVWVTDFGLAKALDTDGLTRTGDAVGTLQYMSPERFRGWSDPRSDVYSLGATLYELTTLESPFRGVDRAKLMREIIEEDPTAPRSIDPRVPLDLETILMKSLAKDPADRYESAVAFRDDLKRFAAGQPIHARRTTTLERVLLLVRRNPVVSALAATIVVAITTAAVIATVSAIQLSASSETLGEEKSRALDRLWRTQLEQVRAGRRDPRSSTRAPLLRTLAAAAEYRPSAELRTEAISALVRRRFEVASTARFSQEDHDADFHPAGGQYAVVQDRTVEVRSLDGTFPVVASRKSRLHGLWRVSYSPSGERIVIRGLRGIEVLRNDPTLTPIALLRDGDWYRFDPSGRLFARSGRSPKVIDLNSGEAVDSPPWVHSRARPSFDRSGELVACVKGSGLGVDLVDTQSGQKLAVFEKDKRIAQHALSPSGEVLAIAREDFSVRLFKTETGERSATLLDAEGRVSRLEFCPDETLVAGSGWDGHSRVWDARNGKLLSEFRNHHVDGFSRDGASLFLQGKRALVVDIRRSPMRFVLDPRGLDVTDLQLSPESRWIAVSGRHGVMIFDLRARKLLARLPIGLTNGVQFRPGHPELITAGAVGVWRWPFQLDASELRVGPPIEIDRTECPTQPDVSRDGSRVAVRGSDWNAVVIRIEQPDDRIEFPPGSAAHGLALSPDMRFVATGHWNGDNALVHSLEPRKTVLRVATEISAGVLFLPDGRLAVSGGDRLRVFEPTHWKPAASIAREGRGRERGDIAVSGDGKVLAQAISRHRMRLTATATLEPLVELDLEKNTQHFALNRDGSVLAYVTFDDLVHVWRLIEVRRELRPYGLDWSREEVPAASREEEAAPEKVRVDLGSLDPSQDNERTRDRIDAQLKKRPDDLRLLHQRAWYTMRMNRPGEAIQDYGKALAKHDNPRLKNALAWILATSPEELRDLDRADGLVREALKVSPDSYAYLHTFAVVQCRLGSFDDAIDSL
ncbi:MAG: protein kinase, partial [Planctomycetota bacterium]